MAQARFYYQDPQAPPPTKTTIGACALIERDGALLLERRTDCGRWSLIGGSVQHGESLAGALVREVREETGLAVTDYQLFGTFSDPSRVAAYPDGNVVRIITMAYRVQVASFELLACSDESLELHFVPLSELPALDIVETHRHIVNDYLAGHELVLK
ncbi:MAG TPA: NUDIX domain-containing protein [Symbiobacteriaceae bacterium]|nr:NUDIX domain-containing protein [Symbiobacteriaceae bacterium]